MMNAAPSIPAPRTTAPSDPPKGWSYDRAFARNLGLINPAEQRRLQQCRVAIAGMGGVGGVDAVTLARLGIGRFTIADPDTFDVVNTNRQYGALAGNFGKSKSRVMADVIRQINPDADIRVFDELIGPDNADEFLDGADLFVDGIDAFELNARRLLFGKAHQKGIWSITAGPVGFSAVWITFDPAGMTFDRYFDLNDKMDAGDRFAAFIAGVAPKATHRVYTDLSYVDLKAHTGPSTSLACQIASGAMACEAVKILLKRGRLSPAPWYQQFDPYVGRFIRRRLWGGNRNPIQRLKRHILLKIFRSGEKP